MRYKLDANGYVESAFWGCYSNGCAEYTGTVPYGYTDLNDWSENALINAYYLVDGNLTLDSDRLKDLEAKIEQDTIDNEPLYRKDLYGTSEAISGTYTNETAKGEVLAIDNVKRINPKVKITDIECYKNEITEKSIEWDGDTTGKEAYFNGAIYKVSDVILNPKDVIGQTMAMTVEGEVIEAEITEDDVVIYDENQFFVAFFITVVIKEFVDGEQTITPGVYFAKEQDEIENYYISKLTYKSETIVPAQGKIDLVTQGKNMLKNDAITETIEGVTFTKLTNGGIKINGSNLVPKTIEWNGDITGREAMEIVPGMGFYKVSNEVLKFGSTVGGKITLISGDSVTELNIISNDYQDDNNSWYAIVNEDNTGLVMVVEKYSEEMPFSQGTYFMGYFNADNGVPLEYVSSLTYTSTASEIKYIDYNLSGSSTNTTPIFALKKGVDYYLNVGGFDCELKYYDGTTSQVYTGASGVINLSENKEVTQVLIKIPIGTTIEQTIYPMLECGISASEYEEYKHRILTIDFSKYISEDALFPSDTLYPSDDLFPKGTSIDYIYIENGSVYISVNGTQKYLMKANVNLFDGFNTVYTMQDTKVEMTYCINNLKLEGTTTKNNNFKVLEDGSIEAHNGYFSGTVNAIDGNFAGTINTNKDLIVGNNAYIGQNQSSTNIDQKHLYFSDDIYFKRTLKEDTEHISLNTPSFKVENGDYSCSFNDDNMVAQYPKIQLDAEDYLRLFTSGDGTWFDLGDGKITSNRSITTTSDERLKQNIEDIDVSWINELKLKEFEYIHTPNKKQIGLIAQDYLDKDYSKYFLETIKIPNDEQEYYGISYGNITNALIKYCQELSSKVEALEKRIKEMEEK